MKSLVFCYFLFCLSFLASSFLLSLLFHDDLDTFEKYYLVVIGLHCWLSWRRRWHPTPVLVPGKSHGWRSLVGCSPWGREESDTTEWLPFHFSLSCVGEGNGNPLHSVLAWRIPGMGEPGGLPSMGSHRVRHDWIDLAAAEAGSVVKNPTTNAGDVALISAWGRSPGEGHGNPLQYSCLEESMDRGGWWATVHGVAKSWTQLSN